MMKHLSAAFGLFALVGGSGMGAAAAPVRLTLEAAPAAAAIPDEFSGLSFEISRVLPEKGWRYFSPKNEALVGLFRTLGVRSVRIGGNTTDEAQVGIPDAADLDDLFAFADAIDGKVIYSVRLKGGDVAGDARIAKDLSERHRARLKALAIGNEPNFYYKTYAEYRPIWDRYRAAILAAAPQLPLCGPSVGPAPYLKAFIAGSGKDVGFLSTHIYFFGAGGSVKAHPVGPREITPAQGIERMLAKTVHGSYQRFYSGFAPAAQAAGLPYRLEEANSFYNGGAPGVSNTFASALWALDVMHWFAARQATGLNFHTGDFVAAGQAITTCKYAAFVTAPGGYAVRPLGYAMKAFDLGGHGSEVPLKIDNPGALNLAAYAVRGTDGSLCVTIVNKEHGPHAAAAQVALPAARDARTITLRCASNDVAATEGVTLGDAAIGLTGQWTGHWTPLPLAADAPTLSVAPATAVVVRLFGL